MGKEYVFEFFGTKEDFMEKLKSFPHDISFTGEEFYYFEDYIVKIVNEELHFGVQRGGHSGGYWFIPAITEYEDKLEFRGTVQYIGPNERHGIMGKLLNSIEFFLLFLLFLPIILIIWCILFIRWIIRKVRKVPKKKTTEDRLFELMEQYLGCTKIKR